MEVRVGTITIQCKKLFLRILTSNTQGEKMPTPTKQISFRWRSEAEWSIGQSRSETGFVIFLFGQIEFVRISAVNLWISKHLVDCQSW